MATIWMIGTKESVKRDSFTDGPALHYVELLQYMHEGDILVGKLRNTKVVFMGEMVDGKIKELQGYPKLNIETSDDCEICQEYSFEPNEKTK